MKDVVKKVLAILFSIFDHINVIKLSFWCVTATPLAVKTTVAVSYSKIHVDTLYFIATVCKLIIYISIF